MVKFLLFDLDNTLYPASCGLDREIDRLMTLFVAEYLEISVEESHRRRKTEAIPYGTTLTWLREALSFHDEERYFEAVHPKNVDAYIDFDPGLPAMLGRIELPKTVLTNSPKEHAERVLKHLGIAKYFDRVLDIRFNGYSGKPHREVYERAVKLVGYPAEDILFIDDLPRYLLPFREIGGQGLLVDEAGHHANKGLGLPAIRKITELEGFLAARV